MTRRAALASGLAIGIMLAAAFGVQREKGLVLESVDDYFARAD
jgi:predicted outer membrane lipoprotein